jgi:hypothetical protein
MERVKSEGDFAKSSDDLRKNVIRLLKYNSIQSYMQKTGLDTPKYVIDPDKFK